MIKIVKKPEPALLAQYRIHPENSGYDGLPQDAKNAVRQQLLDEQGYLCAYCMQRLENDPLKTKIEHWHCQEKYRNEQLDYKNMLVVCKGNEGQPPENQHCDTKKGSQELHYNPSEKTHYPVFEEHITYSGDGTIKSTEPALETDLEVLNLNYSRLKTNRKEVLTALLKVLSKEPGKRTPSEIQQLLANWQQKDKVGAYKEYCGIACYYLNKKLKSIR
jgi:uncharacterized protein (TIGR02646 family)